MGKSDKNGGEWTQKWTKNGHKWTKNGQKWTNGKKWKKNGQMEKWKTRDTEDCVSGVGGQVDFVRGAALGLDGLGKPILAMPSVTAKGESKIVPFLKEGRSPRRRKRTSRNRKRCDSDIVSKISNLGPFSLILYHSYKNLLAECLRRNREELVRC